MAQTDPSPAEVRVAGGDFIRGLDLPAAVTAERSGAPSPGMLTDEERALLSETVRRTWRGDGAIVDGGSFLGSSLMAEAQGLVASPALAGIITMERFPSGKPIHGYELGRHPAPSNLELRHRRYGEIEYERGESFVPLLEQVIAPHRHLIELHIGDLTEMRWDGSPVEVAFIDVCKTAELNAHVSRQFYPALIAGGSTLIHQDFFYDRLPWIRVTMGYLADYVRWAGQVASSSVYEVVRSIPESVAAYDPFTAGTLDECLRYHDAVEFPGIDRTAQLMIALSRVHLVNQRGPHEHALAELERVAVEHVDILGTMSRETSYQPQSGTADSLTPRYRMDRAITEVLARADPAPRTRRRSTTAAPPPEVSRTTAALHRRDWAEARRALAPLLESDSPGPGPLLLARTEFESGNHDAAATLLDNLLAKRPRNHRARALRARIHLVSDEHDRARDEATVALQAAPGLVMARRVLFDLAVAERLRQADADDPTRARP